MAAAHPPHISIIPRPHNHKVKIKPSSQTLARSITPSSIIPKSKQSNDVKKPIESPISVDHQRNNVDKIPKTSKTKMIVITLGVIIGVVAIAGLGIGLYTVIQNSKTTTATTSASSQWTWSSTATIIAGTGTGGSQINQLSSPVRIMLDSSNTVLYIADSGNNRVSKTTIGSSTISIVVGQSSGQSGANMTSLNQPQGVHVDSSGNIYIADRSNHRVQLWRSNGSSIITVAGNGSLGTALNQLNYPVSVTLDQSSQILYVADTENDRIIGVQLSTLTPSLAAGGNGAGYSSAQLYRPIDVYYDASSKSLFIVNNYAHTVVRWAVGGTSWMLVAGTPSSSGSTALTLTFPCGVMLDSSGNIYIADQYNHRIQFYISGNLIGRTIAGQTSMPGSTSSLLSYPRSVAVDSQFNIYVSDTNNNRILKFQAC